MTGLPPTVHSSQPTVRGWLLLLCFLLVVWQPASLAMVAAGRMAAIATGGAAVGPLLVRLIVTAVGVAAGIALWTHQPRAVTLARAALVLSAIEGVARLSSRDGMSVAPPGTRLPLALLIVCYHVAWLAYLQKSKQVKATYE